MALTKFLILKRPNGEVELGFMPYADQTHVHTETLTAEEWIQFIREMSVSGPTPLNNITARQLHLGG